MRKKFLIYSIISLISFLSLSSLRAEASERLQTFHGDKPVIVIDPGHGGENQGTIENNHEEKVMTLITATAMYEELTKFDDVTVYMTRTEDVDLSLKVRAEYAASVDADFLVSIHYNASVDHDLFGSEIWIPHEYPYNNYAYQFGYEFLSYLKNKDLFIRGIKTKLNDKEQDYYGIIREANRLSIPAVILEHCHVDEARDEIYCETREQWVQFGIDDAHAMAKYLGLKSNELGIDYSDYSLQPVPSNTPVDFTLPDKSAPDVCEIELKDINYNTGLLSVNVSAVDYDSCLIYYDYSLDGGNTYSILYEWPGCDTLSNSFDDTFTLNLQIPSGSQPTVIVRAYNVFDLFTESNPYTSDKVFYYGQKEEISSTADIVPADTQEPLNEDIIHIEKEKPNNSDTISILVFFKICILVAVFIFLIFILSQVIYKLQRRRKRR